MFDRFSQSRREEAGFTLIELLIAMIIVATLAAVAIPVFTNQKVKANRNLAIQDGRALSQEVVSMLSDYTNYGSTSGSIAVSGATLTVTMGTSPTPAVASTTSTVRVSAGSTVTGNLPTGAQTSPTFCLRVTNSGQNAVYTQAGYQPAATTCTAGAAS